MKEYEKTTEILTEKNREGQSGREKAEAAVLSLLLLCGILMGIRELRYSFLCVEAAMGVGALVIFLRSLTMGKERAERALRVVLYIVCISCLFAYFNPIRQGFLFTVDGVIYLWNLRFQTELSRLAVGSSSTGAILLWILGAVPLGNQLFSSVSGKKPGFPLGAGLFALFFAMVLGNESEGVTAALLLVGFLGLLMFCNAPGRRAGVRLYGSMILMLGCLAGVWLGLGGYREQKGLEDWKTSVSRGVEALRYGEDSLPEGRLTEESGLLEGDGDRLQVTMTEPEELYLRGFVGSIYAGSRWEKLPGEAYSGDYEGILKWLEKKGFSSTTQYASYAHLDAETANQSPDDTAVQVKNENASRKYLYLPAGVSTWQGSGGREQKDWQVESRGVFGTFQYQFSMVKQVPAADGAIPGAWISYGTGEAETQYLDAEAVYRSFVEASYLEIDEETESLIREAFFPEEEDLNFDEVTSRIRQVLRIITQYQKKPQDIGENGDLARWFLSEYKRGNAISYATAAVLAYRAAGYPARYVEGYHLTADQAAEAQESGDTTITLTTENAHAWAEVYVTGMGWLPVEVVPGMYVETYTSERVEGKPTYQVKPSENNQDLLAEEEGEGGDEEPQEPEPGLSIRKAAGKAAAGILLCLYLCLLLYLILELQRALRLAWKERREKERYPEGKPVDAYVERTEKLLRFVGIQADFRQPEAVRREAEEKKLGLEDCNFDRVLELVRKARFGGKALTPHERRALEGYSEMVEEILKEHVKLPGRLVLRYGYLVK